MSARIVEADAAFVARLVPTLAPDANKYTRGVCELVVGSAEYPGAAVLACGAANRMGAGYVRAYASEPAAAALHIVQPSAVAAPFSAFSRRSHECSEHHPLATVVGCGFPPDGEFVELALSVLRATRAPVLVDGGGLAALATSEGRAALRARREEGLQTVVTPHGGEAARLLKSLSSEGPGDAGTSPAEQALLIAQTYGVVCVFKGPDTFIAAPASTGSEGLGESAGAFAAAVAGDGSPAVAITDVGSPADIGASAGSGAACTDAVVLAMREGTPALAKAGTGDILAGTVGGLLAQGMPPVDACALGTFAHARAGRLAAADAGGELCVAAEDVLAHLPAAVASISATA